jgi:hypothetical protein
MAVHGGAGHTIPKVAVLSPVAFCGCGAGYGHNQAGDAGDRCSYHGIMQPARPRQPQAKPLRDMLDAIIEPVMKAQGFASRAVIQNWRAIVGERLAEHTRPIRINWPRHRPVPGETAEPAALVLRVEGAFALDAQQMSPIILERINAHLGWRCIGKLVLKQGPLPEAGIQIPVPQPAIPSQTIQAATAQVQDAGLRDALTRLGAAVAARRNGLTAP